MKNIVRKLNESILYYEDEAGTYSIADEKGSATRGHVL